MNEPASLPLFEILLLVAVVGVAFGRRAYALRREQITSAPPSAAPCMTVATVAGASESDSVAIRQSANTNTAPSATSTPQDSPRWGWELWAGSVAALGAVAFARLLSHACHQGSSLGANTHTASATAGSWEIIVLSFIAGQGIYVLLRIEHELTRRGKQEES